MFIYVLELLGFLFQSGKRRQGAGVHQLSPVVVKDDLWQRAHFSPHLSALQLHVLYGNEYPTTWVAWTNNCTVTKNAKNIINFTT